jgi:phage shock protein A
MALITRISRLFRADFNAVLDRIEEPDVLLKQALREMEEDIHSDFNQLYIFKKECSQLKTKIKELETNINKIDQELDVCFDANEIELARTQVKRKIEILRYGQHLKYRTDSLEEKISELNNRITENKTKLTSMKQKLELLVDDESQAIGDECFSNSHYSSCAVINEDEIEIAFLHEKKSRRIL